MSTIADNSQPIKRKKGGQKIRLHPNLILASERFSITFLDRFWPRVKKTSYCWIWTGSKAKGYGQIRRGGKSAGMIKTHSASWIIHNGSIPDGLWVLHHCDNPSCVNPAHLWLGTALDNSADRDRKGRHRTGKLTPAMQRWNRKLTHAAAKRIRKEYAQGLASQRELARRFGVSHTTIVCCLKGRTWKR